MTADHESGRSTPPSSSSSPTDAARAAERSQFDRYWDVPIGTLSVCPDTVIAPDIEARSRPTFASVGSAPGLELARGPTRRVLFEHLDHHVRAVAANQQPPVIDLLAEHVAQLLSLLVGGFLLCLELVQTLLQPEIERVEIGIDGVLSNLVGDRGFAVDRG